MVDQRGKLALLPTGKPVDLATLGQTINKNYVQYNITAEQLYDLQEWIRKQQKVIKEK